MYAENVEAVGDKIPIKKNLNVNHANHRTVFVTVLLPYPNHARAEGAFYNVSRNLQALREKGFE